MEKKYIPIKKEIIPKVLFLSSPISIKPSTNIGFQGIKYSEGFNVSTLKDFYKNSDFIEYNEEGRSSLSGPDLFGGVDSISENFNFSADEMLSVNLPTVNLPEPPENLEDLAENALEGIDAALSIDASLDILSSRNVLAEAALGNIADAESILKDDSEMIVCLNNETFYLVKDKSFIPSSNYIQGRVIPDNYPDVKIPDNEDLLIFNLYRVFISIEVNDNASLMVNMPRLVVVKKNNELYDIDLLDELVFEVEDTLELEANLFDEDFKLEINKKRVTIRYKVYI